MTCNSRKPADVPIVKYLKYIIRLKILQKKGEEENTVKKDTGREGGKTNNEKSSAVR